MSISGTDFIEAPSQNNLVNNINNQDNVQHQLLNPELNSVYDDQAPITDDIFPDRSGFFTGHRIPLELFSKATIQRLMTVSHFQKKKGIFCFVYFSFHF